MTLFSELKRRNVLRVAAAEAAVRCIRQDLEHPSGIMPFVEPHLPFYDPIRNEPVCVELVEELAD